MTSVDLQSDHRSAGAHWAPAALLALVLCAAAASAQAPPAPASAAPSTVPTTGERTLVQLAGESTLVVDGVVTRTESLDDDRLRVYHVRSTDALKGTPGEDLPIVDMRGASSRPALLTDGTRAIVLLRPAPPLSYLAQHLPEGHHFALSGGRDGIVPIANDAETAITEHVVAEAIRIGTLADDGEQRAARRPHAFAGLATRTTRLAADGLAELRGLDDVTTLSADELAAFDGALRTATILPGVRSGLMRLAGERGWKNTLPALKAIEPDSPQVLDAILETRAKLGAPADAAELKAYLASKDPAIRAAAVRGLAELPEPAVGEIGRFATSDADLGVRVAAIDALGTAKATSAVPTLSRTFGENLREVRQASGRALIAIGGPAASDAFVNIALHGADAEARKYAALLLVVSTGKDSPPVQRVLASNPPGEVRNVIEHGLELRHVHQHGAE